jgi:hypothetical protein
MGEESEGGTVIAAEFGTGLDLFDATAKQDGFAT